MLIRTLMLLCALLVGCGGSSFDVAEDNVTPIEDVAAEESAAESSAPDSEPISDAAPADSAKVDSKSDIADDVLMPEPEVTEVELPSSDAIASCTKKGTPAEAGACFAKGSYLEQALSRATAVHRLMLAVRIDDETQGCATGPHAFDVSLNDIPIGSLSFDTAAPAPRGPRTMSATLTLSKPIAPLFGKVRLHIESTAGICLGGGSWTWLAGGSARLE